MIKLSITHRAHGIPFHREGSCNRCIGRESCCPRDCPHLEFRDGGDWCALHDSAEQPQVCTEFPNHPWLHVIKSGQCSFNFVRLDEQGYPSDEPLPFMDEQWQ